MAEAIHGIQARQSVLLSEIARSPEEKIELKKTVHLYSSGAPGFVSENEEILRAMRDVSQAAGDRGIYVTGSGAGWRKLYYPLLATRWRFIIRLVGVRFLEHWGKLMVGRGYETKPILLPAHEAVVQSRNSCSFGVRAYIKRCQVEETIRCVKQS